jgi:hypothetical protein
MTDRKKPSAGFWTTVALVALLVGYPLSFGPWCWIVSRRADDRDRDVVTIYWPIGWLINNTAWGWPLLGRYGEFGMARNSCVRIADEPNVNDRGEITGLIQRNR